MSTHGGRSARDRMLAIARGYVRRRWTTVLERRARWIDDGPVRRGHSVDTSGDVTWCGGNQVGRGSVLDGDISVGFGSRLGVDCFVSGRVSIGRYCSIGAQVALLAAAQHPMHTAASYTSPLLFDGRRKDLVVHPPLHVGHDVWIGHGATVLGGVTIGNGAVIGSGAVVTTDVDDFEIVVGVPARGVRRRFSPEICALVTELAWWELDPEELESIEALLSVDLVGDPVGSAQSLRSALGPRRRQAGEEGAPTVPDSGRAGHSARELLDER